MKLNYIRSLDGIRGLFCLIIIIAHWKLAFPLMPIGYEVLQVFFIMSGFLITRILLHEKEKKKSLGAYVKSFYYKRSFRIFPLYFAFLFAMSLIRFVGKGNEFIQNQTSELEHSGIWLYTYLYNFKALFNFNAGIPFEDSPVFAHLWSLCLEEQFYLIFPFIIFFFSGKRLKSIVIALIIIPTFLRWFGYDYLMSINPDSTWATLLIYRNIFFQIDGMALGAALAIFDFSWIKRGKLYFYLICAAIVLFHVFNFSFVSNNFEDVRALVFDIFQTNGKMNVLGYLHYLGRPETLQVKAQYVYMLSLVNLACFFMILCSIQDKPIGKAIFEHKYTVTLGRISYGMYIYHGAILVAFIKILKSIIPMEIAQIPYIWQVGLFAIYLAIVVLISYLSFNYFEMYFLKLKNKIK